jgi:hypothetical protein
VGSKAVATSPCGSCSKTGATLQCSRCKSVRYCGREC